MGCGELTSPPPWGGHEVTTHSTRNAEGTRVYHTPQVCTHRHTPRHAHTDMHTHLYPPPYIASSCVCFIIYINKTVSVRCLESKALSMGAVIIRRCWQNPPAPHK